MRVGVRLGFGVADVRGVTGQRVSGTAEDWLDSEVEEHSDATPYTSDMWRREAIHRYHAGTGDGEDAFRDWVNGEWTIVDNGGIGGYVGAVPKADCQ